MEEDIDLCCVTETHMNEAREGKFKEIFGDVFHCITSRRMKTKNKDTGSGGVAIVVRKGRGRVREVKRKGNDDIVWAEVEGLGQKIHVAGVYMVPIKSSRYKNNPAMRQELEREIERLRHQGTVIIMGDINSRIGEMPPTRGEGIPGIRRSRDKETNHNGREWMQLMRTVGMVTLTGLYGRAEYTCFNERGSSVADHICIDRRSIGMVDNIESDEEVMTRINTDHSMVIARLKVPGMKRIQNAHSGGEPRPRGRQGRKKQLRLNQVREKMVWERYEKKCDVSSDLTKMIVRMGDAGRQGDNENPVVDQWWEELKLLVAKMEGWAAGIAKEEKDERLEELSNRIRSDREIAGKLEEKRQAWERLKECKDEEEKGLMRRVFNNCKNALSKARRRLRISHKKRAIREIEGLFSD